MNRSIKQTKNKETFIVRSVPTLYTAMYSDVIIIHHRIIHHRKNLCKREMEKDMKKELEVVLDYCWRLVLHSHLINAIPKVDFEL